ncbi:MAG TPA: 4Fe-4S binding protein [Ferrovibrio sp.]|uniref:4Fe-4S binding protein n=1 Tax=Ferrovibrio sp. TaxID=1917215 RepID=UPI002ED627AC
MSGLTVALFAFLIAAGPAQAEAGLLRYLPQAQPGDLVPGADRFGPPQGTPPIVAAYKADKLIGYVYLNTDYVNAAGYSGKPIRILVGVDPKGVITGSRLVEHHEPIVLIGIPQRKIETFLAGYNGFDPMRAADSGDKSPAVDIVSGATVTVMVIGDSLTRSAARVARRIAGAAEPEAVQRDQRKVDRQAGDIANWQALLGEGAIRRLQLTVGEVNDAFADDAEAAKRQEAGDPESGFIDLYVALVSQPAIGRSLLGEEEYANIASRLRPGQEAILVTGGGRYSFKGSGYVRGGIFDRIELVQGTETIRFHDKQHFRIGGLAAAGAPSFKDVDVFVVPEQAEFNAAEPWTLKLLVQRQTGALSKVFRTFELGYALPDKYVHVEKAAPAAVAQTAPAGKVQVAASAGADSINSENTDIGDALAQLLADLTGTSNGQRSLWLRIWHSKLVSICVLAAMIAALTAIFFFQDALVKRPVLFDRIRLGYLAVTLVWLGWVAQAQLSVVNVLAFIGAVRSDFQWSSFLVDPLIFILWFAVAAALLFWGRGPFCGWLCPFGALQELSNRAARVLKIPQIKVPWGLHERLWPIKYIVFLVLFGVSLGSLSMAERLAEIEPFKTAIILRFMREWWFVGFALLLIGAGLFVERFFCRYLCPLGAALAIPGRLRMFDWLKRYRECGNPCMRCHNECPVQAIHPEGHINPNECISCLHCQVLYHHDQKCPVVIQRRLKRERRDALSSPSMRPGGPGHKQRVVAGGVQQSSSGAAAAPPVE